MGDVEVGATAELQVGPVTSDATVVGGQPYYADELVTLYHADCREAAAWLDADVLVTDPPYGIGWRKNLNRAAGSRAHAGIANDSDTTVRDQVLALWGQRPGVVFGALTAPLPASLRQILIWHKPADAGVVGSTTGYRRDIEAVFLTGTWPQMTACYSAVLRSRAMVGGCNSPAGRTGHPHSKPVDLMEQLIASCPAGVIADPFAGSGATLVAAKRQGRVAIGVEVEERYCEVAARRLAQGVMDFGEAS